MGEFKAWCRVYRYLPAVADILFGKCTTQVKGTDQINAIISSLLSCIAKRGAEVTGRELENVCRYASRFLADFSSLFFRRMMKIEGMNLKLVKIFSLVEWMKKNKYFK